MNAIFTLVIEDGPAWYREAFNLVLSLKQSDLYRDAPVVVNVVNSIDAGEADPLHEIGASTRVIDRFHRDSPPCNKLNALPEVFKEDLEAIVLLDSDVIVAGSLDHWLKGRAIAACPERFNQLNSEQWQDLYNYVGREAPLQRMAMLAKGDLTYPYWSSAAVLAPMAKARDLFRSWQENAYRVISWCEDHASDKIWFADQISLALTLTSWEFEVNELQANDLWLTTTPTAGGIPHGSLPAVVHYGDRIEPNGFLQSSEHYPELNPLLHEFNRHRARSLGVAYTGLPKRKILTRMARAFASTWLYRSPLVRRLRRATAFRKVRRRWKETLGQRRPEASDASEAESSSG